jgi:6-phosphogluconolactonase (cycloisomerase 2 family)
MFKTLKSLLIFKALCCFLSVALLFCFVSSKPSQSRKIALLIKMDYQGERSFANRIESACKNLGWKADLFEIHKFNRLKKHSYDFVINLVPGFYKPKKIKSYLAIFHPLHHYFDSDGSLSEPYLDYDGYLLTYLPKADDKNFGISKKPFIPWYPTVQMREYKETNPNTLFYLACVWGNRFEDLKMQQFLNLLDNEPSVRVYGNPLIRTYCPKSYCSRIPFDGDAVCEVAEGAGQTLIFHSDDHNTYGLPSGRIFEAAAASSIIISDENAFVKEHFGDSVLYINTNESAESMHSQIKKHLEWIQLNREAAREKARRAYTIYRNSFSLEEQLMRLGAFHDELSKNAFSNWRAKMISSISSFVKKISCFAAIFPIIDPTPVSVVQNIDSHYSLVNSVDFHPQKNIACATFTHNNKIILYEIDENGSSHPIQTLCNPSAQLSDPQHAVFSPSGDKIVVANWTNQTFTIYPREENQLYASTPITIQPTPVLQNLKPHGIAFSPCGKYLAVAYGAASRFQRGVALFKSENKTLECISLLNEPSLPGIPKGITFSPDGTHLLVSFCEPNGLAVFSIQNEMIQPTPKQILQDVKAHLSRPEDVKISSDGSYLAVSNSDQNTLTFYHFDPSTNSISDSTPFYSLQNPTARLQFPHGIAFSSDGAYLAVTQFGRVQISHDGDICWDQTVPAREGAIHFYQLKD